MTGQLPFPGAAGSQVGVESGQASRFNSGPTPAAHLFIPGTPVPQGSMKAFVNNGRAVVTADNRKTKPWRADVQAGILHHLERSGAGPIAYPACAVGVSAVFVMPRRAAEPKRVTPHHTRKPDVDKLARALLDSMTGLVFTDDSQVVTLLVTKRTARPGEPPGVRLSWYEAP